MKDRSNAGFLGMTRRGVYFRLMLPGVVSMVITAATFVAVHRIVEQSDHRLTEDYRVTSEARKVLIDLLANLESETPEIKLAADAAKTVIEMLRPVANEGVHPNVSQAMMGLQAIHESLDRQSSGARENDESVQALCAEVNQIKSDLTNSMEKSLQIGGAELEAGERRLRFTLLGAALLILLVLAIKTFWVLPRYAVNPLFLQLELMRQGRKALGERESQLRAITESVRDGIFMLDEHGAVAYWNPAAGCIMGYSRADALGKNINELFEAVACGNDRAGMSARILIDETLAGETTEMVVHHKDGSERLIDLSLSSVQLDGAQYAVGAIRDLTESRLREAESRSILQTAFDGFWMFDDTGRLLQVNEAICSLLRYTRKEMLALHVHDFEAMETDEDTQKRMREIRRGRGVRFISRLRTKNGLQLDVEVSAAYIDAGGGRYCAFIRDITDRIATERDLRASEARFRNFFELGLVGMAILRPSGHWNLVNDRLCEILGYSRAELQNLTWKAITHPEDRDRNAEEYRLLTQGKVPSVRFDKRYIRKDGETVYAEIVATRVCDDADCTLDHILTVIIDISARKNFERKLSASEAQFRSYIECSPLGVLVVDGSGHYVDVNPAAAEMLGYTCDELLGKHVYDVVAPEGHAFAEQHFAQVSTLGHASGDTVLMRKDGSTVPVLVHAKRLDKDRFISFHVDLSERKLAEQAVRRQAALDAAAAAVSRSIVTAGSGRTESDIILRHALTLTDGHLGAVVLAEDPRDEPHIYYTRDPRDPANNRDTRFTEIDRCDVPFFRHLWSTLGMVQQEVLSNAPTEEEIFGPEFPPELTPHNLLVAPVLIEGDWAGQIVLANASQGYSPLDLAAVGHLAELLAMSIHNRRTQTALEQSRQQFMHAQKMEAVGRLAGGVAHDFNNLLGIVMGYTDLLLNDTPEDSPHNEFLQAVKKAARGGADLTRQLLTFARKQNARPMTLDLNESVAALTKLLGHLASEDIKIVWTPSVETLKISMDPSQLDQVLANLVVNARDAIETRGEILISAQWSHLEGEQRGDLAACPPGDYALLEVSDDGGGMDREVMRHIFEPFFTTKAEGKGTGLGLATVYGIVHQNRGAIEVTTEPGKGTTFGIYLPICVASTETAIAIGLPYEPAPRGRESILLVEDNTPLLGACTSMLQNLGYEVFTAPSAEEAIAGLPGLPDHFDLLVTDMVLPDMNGRELWLGIRRDRPETRCLFMSGHTTDIIDLHGGLEQGLHFIQKPFSMQDFAKKIRSVLDEDAAVVGGINPLHIA